MYPFVSSCIMFHAYSLSICSHRHPTTFSTYFLSKVSDMSRLESTISTIVHNRVQINFINQSIPARWMRQRFRGDNPWIHDAGRFLGQHMMVILYASLIYWSEIKRSSDIRHCASGLERNTEARSMFTLKNSFFIEIQCGVHGNVWFCSEQREVPESWK